MAGSGGGNPNTAPKILLAKPGLVAAGKFSRGGGGGGADDDAAALRSRLPSVGSLNLLSDSWDFQIDRFLPFLTDNTEFTVVGVIGPPGVGKSTILNEIYGFDSSSPGMLPPFGVESEETRMMARHSTVGIEPRVSSERIILLDTQPVFSPSVLAEMIRPDGSSTISVISGQSLSAELAHEMMSIQLGVLLASVCHIIIVVSEGVHDASMWRLMMTVNLLKHGIPDPSSTALSHPQSSDKEAANKPLESGDEYMAAPIFVHTRVRDHDNTPQNFQALQKGLAQCFGTYSSVSEGQDAARGAQGTKLFLVPAKGKDGSSRPLYESYASALWKVRDQVLSMTASSFSRTVSEREWLKNSGKVWELIKNSPTIADYSTTLQTSGLYRK
ncbi:nonsense-mediated mRNA decay factor SMG9-like isoform X2 [Salvia divinorum]|uniref:Nonsense-mediated mRNA decay factor SMG9-like isoform X2 n=1 Tax=Salvia divinorum TaxID=28513 RepID=A0ABD1GX64_SALDI